MVRHIQTETNEFVRLNAERTGASIVPKIEFLAKKKPPNTHHQGQERCLFLSEEVANTGQTILTKQSHLPNNVAHAKHPRTWLHWRLLIARNESGLTACTSRSRRVAIKDLCVCVCGVWSRARGDKLMTK